ncbi:MAG: hypothetical protein K940chlam9_00408 [Chlamydiae bacterium]|nr:hypothetical protein [Chlamydiota bacterium]
MTAAYELKLKETVEQAMKKIDAGKENDICRYLPSPEGGYLHHFTYGKMKKTNPQECISLIEECILKNSSPRQLDPKPRASRKSKQSDMNLPNEMFGQILILAQEAQDETLLTKLLGSKPLAEIKRELIRSIRAGQINAPLWESYKHIVSK